MSTTEGLSYAFNPGSNEYMRVPVEIAKDDYYLLDRMRAIILSGMGEVLGATKTDDQETTTVEIESQVVDQMEFEIDTHEPRLQRSTTHVTGSLTTGTAGTAYNVSVDDASIFKAYDEVVNETTNEQYLVLDIDTTASPNTINILPAFNSTGFSGKTSFSWTLSPGTPQTKTNGDTLRIIGNAFPEGSSAGTIIDQNMTVSINYVQIFSKEFGLTFEQQNTKSRGRHLLEDKDDRAFTNFLEEMESAIISSQIHKGTVAGAPVRTMLGMKNTSETYNQAASALVGGGNDWTIQKIDQIADQLAPHVKSDRIVCLSSGVGLRKLRSIKEALVEVPAEIGSETFGIKAWKYEGIKPIYFVRHYEFDQSADQAFFFDPANFKLRNLSGGELGYVSDKKGLPGANLTSNDKMAFQDAHYGAYSADYRNEKGCALVTGLQHTISS